MISRGNAHRRCIYCNKLKDEAEFSIEHIFPTALGGKVITDNLFKTRYVCKDCNNKLGLYVDGIFLKNFFIKNFASTDYLGYVDLHDDQYTLPFIYMGINETIRHPDFGFCDYWLWHDGSRVYHFHNNYSEKFNAYAGGNPIGHKDKKRAGEAYLIAVTNNPIWLKKLLFSFKEYFNNASRYSVNINIQQSNEFFNPPTDSQNKMIKSILKVATDEQKNNIVFQLGFEIRFLSKIALALGHNLFGDQYYSSMYANMLRKVIWENDYKKLSEYDHQISNFFVDKDYPLKNLSNIIAWQGGHTIIFFPIDNKLLLLLYISGDKRPIVLTITDVLDQYQNSILNEFPHGCVWILVPQRQVFKGVYGFPEYLAYKTGDKKFIKELEEIEKLYIEFKDQPSFKL